MTSMFGYWKHVLTKPDLPGYSKKQKKNIVDSYLEKSEFHQIICSEIQFLTISTS